MKSLLIGLTWHLQEAQVSVPVPVGAFEAAAAQLATLTSFFSAYVQIIVPETLKALFSGDPSVPACFLALSRLDPFSPNAPADFAQLVDLNAGQSGGKLIIASLNRYLPHCLDYSVNFLVRFIFLAQAVRVPGRDAR